jgi:hypothetical protein
MSVPVSRFRSRSLPTVIQIANVFIQKLSRSSIYLVMWYSITWAPSLAIPDNSQPKISSCMMPPTASESADKSICHSMLWRKMGAGAGWWWGWYEGMYERIYARYTFYLSDSEWRVEQLMEGLRNVKEFSFKRNSFSRMSPNSFVARERQHLSFPWVRTYYLFIFGLWFIMT